MNIFLFHTVDFPNGAAESAHAALIVRGLRKNGQRAFLLIPHGSMLGDSLSNERTKGHVDGVPFFYLNGTTTRSYNIFKSFLEIYYGMINSAILLIKRKLKNKKDVLIIGTPDASRYFPVIITAILLRIPFFIWAVEKSTANSSMLRAKSGLISFLGFKVSESLLPFFSAGCLVISSRLADQYRNRLPADKVIIYPILVDPCRTLNDQVLERLASFRKKYNSKRLIVYSGTFSEKDGINYLLNAFSVLLKNHPNAHFVMTGRSSVPSIMQSVNRQIAHLDLNDHVELVGFVSRGELLCYNLIADILLVCRTKSEYANYGFPWKLGEYCMTGRPILATKVGDIEQYLEDGKDIFMVEPENSEAIAQGMISILNNHDDALFVARSGKKTAARAFDYVGQTKKIIEFLKSNCGAAYI